MNRIFVILAVMVFALTATGGIGYAMCGSCPGDVRPEAHGAAKNDASRSTKAAEVGNTVCPVTGEKIDEASKVACEYKGKIYNFCCEGCIGPFKKDPTKYIAKIEEQASGHQH